MQRITRQRVAVSDLLERTTGFHTAQQLHDMLRDDGESVGLATVYRTLQVLADNGEVDVLRNADGESIFRQCTRQEHHHHLVCRYCGRAEEIDAASVERWAASVGRTHAFVDIEHTAELFGTCAQCAQEGRDR